MRFSVLELLGGKQFLLAMLIRSNEKRILPDSLRRDWVLGRCSHDTNLYWPRLIRKSQPIHVGGYPEVPYATCSSFRLCSSRTSV